MLYIQWVFLCVLAACVGLLNCSSLEKMSIDSKGILDISTKPSKKQHVHMVIDAVPSVGEEVSEHMSSKVLVRKQSGRLPPSVPLPLGNYFGASLLINRTRQRLLSQLQGTNKRATNEQEQSDSWINSTTANSKLVWALIAFMLVGCILSGIIIGLSARSTGADLLREPMVDVQEDGGSGATARDDVPQVEKHFKRKPMGLDEDLYGMGLASLVRDSQRFAMKTELLWLRVGRLAITLLVLAFTMTLQVFLLVEMKTLVTSVSTHEARDIYDKYEIWMYGNNTADMTVTANGYHRGKDGNFDIARFKTLDDDTKDNACQIALSQPTFFIAILLVWSLVCVAEMRRTFDLAGSILIATPTIESMKDSCQETEEQGDEAVVVVGLTRTVKIIATIFILVPRMLVSAALLWLGCRWLTGTMGFSDVLQNAVTLEFILLLKDLFYATMAPHHNKTETRNTLLLPYCEKERPTASIFLGAFLWGVLSIAWVLLYVEFFQQVLPDYRWDIHDACADYLAQVETATPDS